MKLLNTIHNIIAEAENNLYEASLKNDDFGEIDTLNNRVEESLKLLEIYKNLF